MKKIVPILIILSLFLVACNKINNPTNNITKKNTTITGNYSEEENESKPTNFLECKVMSGDIIESYPRQCKLDNLSFTEEIKNNDEVIPTKIVESEEKTIDVKATKAELQESFKDIEANMQVVDDNMQALDIDDEEINKI